MKNKVNIIYLGLQCDNCSYFDLNIKREEFESCINKFCLECGENFLIFGDYMNLLIVENVVEEVSNINIGEKELEEMVIVKINIYKNIIFE